jgi:integrase
VRVRQFFGWLHRTGRLPLDISGWVSLPKKRSTSKRFLTLEQCQELIDAVPDGPLRLRDRALVAFMLATGARRFETSNALWADVHIDDDGGWCRLRKTKGDVDGEGVGRIVVFGPATGQALHFYRQFLRITGQSGKDARVFAMTNTAIKNRFNKISERLWWTTGPHDLRRTFADFWWNENREHLQSMALLKLQLGHRLTGDVTITHYINIANEDRLIHSLRSAYVSPVELLKVLPDMS